MYLGYILSLAVLAGVWGCSGSGNGSGRNAESLLRPPSPAPANIVLISLDTLRADHLGGWGYPGGYSATMDRLAERGRIHRNVYTVIPHTTPGHASLLTGCYPVNHGCRDNGFPIRTDVSTLAQTLAMAGYATAGSVAHFLLSGPTSGLDRGFQKYWSPAEPSVDASQTSDGVTVYPLNANRFRPWPRVNAAARTWLAETPEPFFLFLHYYECHKPYRPPVPMNSIPGLHPYDGEIAGVDSAVAELLRMLHARSALDRTEIIITADHGESLGEHGYHGHGYHLYYPSMSIPWISWYSGGPEGAVQTGLRRIMDIMPSMLQARKIPVPLLIDGRADSETVDTAFGESPSLYSDEPQRRIRSVRTDEYALIYRRNAGLREMYDLKQDPAEKTNLTRRRLKTARKLTRRIESFTKTDTEEVLRPETNLRPEVQDALRALGYMNGE